VGEPAEQHGLHRVTPRGYERHRPEETPLYKIVAEHLESFLAQAREAHGRPLPQYVERELRDYLKCGILSEGFLRARCRSCGKELLVALSCKKRGVCPSCNARRMCGTAAHLTMHVIPDVPMRQWVLSIPFELRLLLARNHGALTAVGRIFVQEVCRWQRERARIAGLWGTRSGAICFPQLFGGSLNLNVHYHVVAPDGVFTLDEGSERANFHRLPKPDHTDLDTLAFDVEMRVKRWLRRGGLLGNESDADDIAEDPATLSALDACLQGSLGVGEITALPANPTLSRPRPTRCRFRQSPAGEVATRGASTCTLASSHQRATARAESGSCAIAPGRRFAWNA
jgi:hypothetical protein